jgi:DNA-binding MarR family transcriptional regulator
MRTVTMGRLRQEIKQRKRFRSAEEEVFLNLQRTADVLARSMEEAVKPAGLSNAQYNVLRILRGAGSSGLACREIGQRMISHDPDVTRLLDRLEARGLVARSREKGDRRVISTRITKRGISILGQLDRPTEQALKLRLGHLGKQQLRLLTKLLELARAHS